MAYSKGGIRKENKIKRVQYGHLYKDQTINDFWRYVIFTDEFHMNPHATPTGFILREEGTRYDDENMDENRN